MIKVIRNSDYLKVFERKFKSEYEDRCVICGRPVSPESETLHIHNGGGWFVTEDEARKLSPDSDLGVWLIGRCCLKNHSELAPYTARAQHIEARRSSIKES